MRTFSATRTFPFQGMAGLWHGFENFAFPSHCVCCDLPLEHTRFDLCTTCAKEVTICGADFCMRCGMPMGPGIGARPECDRCADVEDGFGLDGVVALGRHEGVLRELVLALKFGNHRAIADALAAWMVQVLSDRGITSDVVVPVPLGRFRRWQRGYNQSAEIARRLARRMGSLYAPDIFARVRETPQQALLSEAQRRANVSGAFRVTRRAFAERILARQRVLIVDDVLTTGATMRECAKLLRVMGAREAIGVVATRSTHRGE